MLFKVGVNFSTISPIQEQRYSAQQNWVLTLKLGKNKDPMNHRGKIVSSSFSQEAPPICPLPEEEFRESAGSAIYYWAVCQWL